MADTLKEHISKYSFKELLEAESSLDKASFPEKHALLQDEIAKRRTAGEYVSQAYACPSCRKLTISHCDMQSFGVINCSECGEQNYLDPYRSVATSVIGGFGIIFGAYLSLWFALVGLIIMIILRDKWVIFVPKGVATLRNNTINLVIMIASSLIGLSFTIWAILSDPSEVPDPRYGFIAMMAIATIFALGFSVHYLKIRNNIKN